MSAARARRWPIADDVAALEPERLRLYLLFLDSGSDPLESRADILSEDERRTRDRFQFPADRRRFAMTRTCLRLVLGHFLEMPPGEIQFEKGEFGKPFVKGSEVHFNVARSGRLALLAFSLGSKVGVDLEQIKTEKVNTGLARSAFSPAELAQWRSQDPDDRRRAFFEIWTRKEALLKATGVGLSFEPRTLSLELEDDQALDISFAEPPTWAVHSMEAPEGFAAAVSCPGRSLEFDCWTVDAGGLAADSSPASLH